MCCNLKLLFFAFLLVGSALSRKLNQPNAVNEIFAIPQFEDDYAENSEEYEDDENTALDRIDLRNKPFHAILGHQTHCEEISIHEIVTDMFILHVPVYKCKENIKGKPKVKTINIPRPYHSKGNVQLYVAEPYEIKVGCLCMEKKLKSNAEQQIASK